MINNLVNKHSHYTYCSIYRRVRQPGNETWSVNKIYFSSNIMQKMRQTIVLNLFLFFKKAFYDIKASEIKA